MARCLSLSTGRLGENELIPTLDSAEGLLASKVEDGTITTAADIIAMLPEVRHALPTVG